MIFQSPKRTYQVPEAILIALGSPLNEARTSWFKEGERGAIGVGPIFRPSKPGIYQAEITFDQASENKVITWPMEVIEYKGTVVHFIIFIFFMFILYIYQSHYIGCFMRPLS